MWKTIRYSVTGEPLLDVNEQGVVYSYKSRSLKKLHKSRPDYPYLCWVENTPEGSITCYLHVEVAKAFPEICGKWFKGCHVHHKDGNPSNNEAKNLLVCTPEKHMKLHQKMRQQRKRELKEEIRQQFLEDACNYTNTDDYTFHYYCRKSKVDRNGYSPIELVIYRKSDGKKITKYTGFKQKPADFNNGIMPDGFETYDDALFK